MESGSPVTLHTLATMMMADGDYTEADALVDFVGRDRPQIVSGFVPFSTTREHWLLQSYDELYRRHLGASDRDSTPFLSALADLPPPTIEDGVHQRQPQAG